MADEEDAHPAMNDATKIRRPCSIIALMLLVSLVFTQLVRAQDEAGGSARPARPNILFLFADDQRPDTIGAWGNDEIRTPHIDGLAREGFSFRANYCMGSPHGAVCLPSRAMLMSGMAYFRVPSDLEGVTMLPEVLARNGYLTFGTGKWHNGARSFERGFERGRGVFLGGMSDHTLVPIHDLDEHRKLGDKRVAKEFSSELFANQVIEFLGSHDGERPFFAYCAFSAPHDPRQPPGSYREMYHAAPPPLPANFLPQHPFDIGDLQVRDEKLAAWPREESVIRDQLCEYYGLISHLDAQIGRILAALEESDFADDTIVVYAADHGLAMGSHGLLGKQSVYEHSMGCPLIIKGPGIPKGSESRAFTYLLDLFPTIAAMTGTKSPPALDGRDLSPVIAGEKAGVRDSIFLAYGTTQRAVRDGRWKLIRYPKIDHLQLFDLEADPDEMRDLGGEPEQAERIARMTELMRGWQRGLGDDLPLRVADPLPMAIDLSGRERKPDRWQPEWIRKMYFD